MSLEKVRKFINIEFQRVFENIQRKKEVKESRRSEETKGILNLNIENIDLNIALKNKLESKGRISDNFQLDEKMQWKISKQAEKGIWQPAASN